MNNFHVPLVPGGPGASAIQGVCIFSVIGFALGGVLGSAATIDVQSTAIIAIAGGVFGGILGLFLGGDSQSQDLEHAWSVVGYVVILGLVITVVGSILRLFVHEWWPLFVAAIGMLVVVSALWHGRNLAQH
jgi:hypothetical protein